VTIFRFWSSQYVRHLEAEILWLRTQAEKERQAKEEAVSAMVSVKTRGLVSLPVRPLIPDREREGTTQIEDLFKDPEFSRAGQE